MPDRIFAPTALQPYADRSAAVSSPWTDDPAAAQTSAPTPKKKGIGWGPYAAMVGGNAADLATTIPALARGGREANPVMGSMGTAGMIGTKLGGAALIGLLMRAIADKHPGLASGLGYGDGAATAAIAAHNATVNR